MISLPAGDQTTVMDFSGGESYKILAFEDSDSIGKRLILNGMLHELRVTGIQGYRVSRVQGTGIQGCNVIEYQDTGVQDTGARLQSHKYKEWRGSVPTKFKC